jgi:hypothetical protein
MPIAMSIVRRKRPGDDIDAYCTRCKMDLTHTVLTMATLELPERVRCNTCGSEHRFIRERSARPEPRTPRAAGDGPAPPERRLTTREEIERMEPEQLVDALRELLLAGGGTAPVELGRRWEGGTLLIKPGKPGLQEKEIPIDTFFKKIVMVRERLRVLEQQINGSETLSDAEKLAFQQYITRCYGSLTTFNVLFENRDDWFVGERKSE